MKGRIQSNSRVSLNTSFAYTFIHSEIISLMKEGDILMTITNKNDNNKNKNKNSSESNQAQSAGAPGSAGIVGSKRWIKAQMENKH